MTYRFLSASECFDKDPATNLFSSEVRVPLPLARFFLWEFLPERSEVEQELMLVANMPRAIFEKWSMELATFYENFESGLLTLRYFSDGYLPEFILSHLCLGDESNFGDIEDWDECVTMALNQFGKLDPAASIDSMRREMSALTSILESSYKISKRMGSEVHKKELDVDIEGHSSLGEQFVPMGLREKRVH